MASQAPMELDNTINCTTCQHGLADYVRRQLTNQPADPALAFHIATCSACQARYFAEYRTQGVAQPLAALQQVGRRAGVAHILDQIVLSSAPSWWQQITEELQRLVLAITVRVQETTATFVDLPAGLAPQRVATLAFRSQQGKSEQGVNAIELLTLPAPDADLQIKVSTDVVANQKSTLIIQLVTMTNQPLAQVRTTLRDDKESLLEQSASDSDGLVSFGELESGKYNIQIKHGGQTWAFSVVLYATVP